MLSHRSLGGQPEQRVADDDSGVITGQMGELEPRPRGTVATSPMAKIRRLLSCAAARRPPLPRGEYSIAAASRSRPEIGDRSALRPVGHQKMRTGDQAFPALRTSTTTPPSGKRADDRLHERRPSRRSTPSSRSRAVTTRGQSRIVLGQAPDRRLQHHHVGTEPTMRLRHLQPDRTGADHHQLLRPFGQLEDRLIGQIGDLRQTGIGGTAAREPVATMKRFCGDLHIAGAQDPPAR